ncbi:MAG TPA: hypothetical protein VJ302_37805 [Blastocatellia bacterium]|nr:hypothetical protein [Blastocatellia bacterium]
MSKKTSVFTGHAVIITKKSVRDPRADSHIPISRSDAADFALTVKPSFIREILPGQSQTITRSGDEVIQVETNQTTSAVGQIVLESENAHIHIKAASEITLEVGNSKLIMKSDGTIQLIGIKIFVEADQILSQATTQHTIMGGRVDINP